MSSCPPRGDLADLLRDNLDGPRREGLEAHLGSCPACQRDILSMAGGPDPLAWRLVRPDPSPFDLAGPRAGFLADLKQRLRSDRDESPDRGGPPASRGEAAWPAIRDLEILAELGRGGMGVVYKARQVSLDRIVALKVIRLGERGTPTDRLQSRRGARALARLRHPNVVEIYFIGEQDGHGYGVLEFVEGGTLEAWAGGNPWPPRRAAGLVRTLAEAADSIHRHGIVHRDLKPSNILMTLDGSPKIADFGIARLLDDSDDCLRPGDVIGSPGYMAPEQVSGRAPDIGPATDLYALGAILYRLLTGLPPFHGATSAETLRQVLDRAPVPPSRLRPEVPPALEEVCLRCLQKGAQHRYPDARQLAADLIASEADLS
jgi:eukaryotic-like serine/threonine-protein kinase